jgi:di/tricarboxylate transporter
MTLEILIVLLILGIAGVLFVTDRIRMDLVALLVLVTLTFTQLVTPAEALSGFSNPAVVTVWAVLILGGALSRTGVASLIGVRMLKFVGTNDIKMIAVIMVVAGFLSGIMNNIGVASLFLPVVIVIARRTKKAPSKLLIPLSYATLLGGLMTLIGTPPNILISGSLRQAGLEPFGMFDFTPVGLFVMLAGVLFMVFVGRHILPTRDITQETGGDKDTDYSAMYDLHERIFTIRVPESSKLAGKPLSESRLSSALGLNVIAILRGSAIQPVTDPNAIILGGDRLLVEGRNDRLEDILGKQHLELEAEHLALQNLVSAEIGLIELTVSSDSPLVNQTLAGIGFRDRFDLIVLAIRRGHHLWRTHLEGIHFQTGDILLAQARRVDFDSFDNYSNWFSTNALTEGIYHLEERLMMVRLRKDSSLVGKSLVESRFGEAFELGIMGIIRDGDVQLMPAPNEILMAGDILMVKGKQESLLAVEGLQNLVIDKNPPDMDTLEAEGFGMVEAILSPHTTLAGKSLQELNFRTKYGLNVLAIWREGKAYRTDLRDMALRFGDALLLYGLREKAILLGDEPDFIVLAEGAGEKPRLKKAPVALTIMALVLMPVILGWVDIAIAAVTGVVLMVLTRCLTMEEAYRSIQLNAVFLIAGMLPLGIAMEKTGAAQFLAEGMVSLVGGYGPMAVMAGLFILVSLASQVMPNPAVAVLLAPIALSTAADLGVSPYPLMMTVAISASASFLSPVGHTSNLMIMGPGGYKFGDFIKVGLPLTLVVMIVVLLVTPLFWPF